MLTDIGAASATNTSNVRFWRAASSRKALTSSDLPTVRMVSSAWMWLIAWSETFL